MSTNDHPEADTMTHAQDETHRRAMQAAADAFARTVGALPSGERFELAVDLPVSASHARILLALAEAAELFVPALERWSMMQGHGTRGEEYSAEFVAFAGHIAEIQRQVVRIAAGTHDGFTEGRFRRPREGA